MSPGESEKQICPDSISRHNEKLAGHLRETDFEAMSAESILTWASTAFAPGRAVLSTSFQYSGVAMIHMLRQLGPEIRIATVDTLRLHPETYAYIRELEQHYGIEIEVQRPDPEKVRSMVDRFGEYLFFDSKAKQEYCCQVRKLKPHDELLKTVDCWISGVRRDQSAVRERTRRKRRRLPSTARGGTSSSSTRWATGPRNAFANMWRRIGSRSTRCTPRGTAALDASSARLRRCRGRVSAPGAGAGSTATRPSVKRN